MRARFIGDPRHGGEGPSLLPFMGVVFAKGEWLEEVPAAVFAKVSGNSHFEAELTAPASEPATVIVTNSLAQDRPDTEVAALQADLTALDVKFDKRWGAPKLRAALDAATAPSEA